MVFALFFGIVLKLQCFKLNNLYNLGRAYRVLEDAHDAFKFSLLASQAPSDPLTALAVAHQKVLSANAMTTDVSDKLTEILSLVTDTDACVSPIPIAHQGDWWLGYYHEAAGAPIIKRTLKDYRKDKKLTQTELAQQLGITQSAVAKMEAGTLIVSDELWAKAAEIVGCTIEDIK